MGESLICNNSDNRAYRVICFDLDGTLLPMEIEDFLKPYFKAIREFVTARGHNPQQFSQGFDAGVSAMMSHAQSLTNEEAFWDEYCRYVDKDACDWPALLNEYYAGPFADIGYGVTPNPATKIALQTLQDKGYPLILATMPLFPLTAVKHRLHWAGIDAGCFSRITTYENSTSTKPYSAYYAEIIAACNAAAPCDDTGESKHDKGKGGVAEVFGSDLLMVGNNTLDDLAFCKLGADAYLVTDHLINPIDLDISSVKHGTMEQFSQWAQTLPPCEHPLQNIVEGRISLQETKRTYERNRNENAKEAADEDYSSYAYSTDYAPQGDTPLNAQTSRNSAKEESEQTR